MATNPTRPDDDRPASVLPRYFAGEGPSQERPISYVLLVPSDRDIDPASLMREAVTDVLRRNGYPCDPKTVETLVEAQRGKDGRFDFDRNTAGAQDATRDARGGPTDKDGMRGPSIHGYSIVLRQDFQEGVVAGAAKQYSDDMANSPESRQKVIDVLSKLKDIAGATGNKDLEKTLDTLALTMKTQDNQSAIDGTKAGLSSLKAVMELAKKSGLDQEAADALGRMTAVFSLPVDSADFCKKIYGVYNGVDPNTGKSLTQKQRSDMVLDVASTGFSIADGAAKVSILFGASETGAALTVGSLATGAGAALAWAKVMKDVVERGQAAINNMAALNFNERFPPASGATPQDTIASILRRTEAMPTQGQNALSTVSRIIDNFDGDKGETRARFIAYLKKTVEPDSVIDKLAAKKYSDIDLTGPEMERLAKHVKRAVNSFMELEIADVKHCTLPKGGLTVLPEYAKKKGEYLDQPLPGGAKPTDVTKPEPAPHAPRPPTELEKILFPGLHNKPLEKLFEGVPPGKGLSSGLSESERANVTAALGLSAAKNGLGEVNAVMLSKDGSRLIAVQGDPNTSYSRQASIDVREAAAQPAERSLAQLDEVRQARETRPRWPVGPNRCRAHGRFEGPIVMRLGKKTARKRRVRKPRRA
jgi:hypothetical protein